MAADFDSEMGSKNKRKSEVKKKQHTALRSNVQSYIYHIHGSNSYAFNLFICNFLINTYYGIITIGGCFFYLSSCFVYELST